jgi:pyridoxamine 5'-phosphate oxidase
MSEAEKPTADLRREYARETLDEKQVAPDPFDQFDRWFEQALKSDLIDANAMTLATCDQDLQPAARMVLLKSFDAQGFVFFTNYDSRKGHELARNSRAALLFYWGPLERQVRIEGSIEKLTSAESDDYFLTRPLGARLGAWASPQSHVVEGRIMLEDRLAEFQARFGADPPRPPHWGGYRLSPNVLEFWQGRPNRLHDRVRYTLQNDMRWRIERLAP